MKKIALFVILLFTCNISKAVFLDGTHNYSLMHCDSTNQSFWLITPDNNSSGRTASEPILDKKNTAFEIDTSTQPILMPNSPKGGSYFSFDGINDSIYINGGWKGGTDVQCDFSFRWRDLPPSSDNFAALYQTVPFRSFLSANGNKGYVRFLMKDGSWITSTKMLDSNTWYDVHFKIVNGTGTLTVGDTTTVVTGLTVSDESAAGHIGMDLYSVNRFFKGDIDEVRVGYIAPYPENSTACVKELNGSPTMFINDEAVAPMMFYGYADQLPGDSNCKFAQQAQKAKNAGVHLYTFAINFQGIFGDGVTYWETVDSILTAVTNLDNEAMMMPRFYIYPSPWYMTANPDIHMEWSDGTTDRICLASEKWRNYMKDRVRDFVNHCECKFGENILGYHITLMDTGEWFYEKSWENLFSGYSENMRLGFANWAQNKYGTEAALRTAWNDGSVTFATITLPTTSARGSSASAFFRNPATEKKTIDFYEYKNYLVPETIDIMAGAIKNASQSNKIATVFYGYSSELATVPKGSAITGHLGLKKLLESPNVDIIAGPMSYVNRRAGGICAMMSATDSIRKAGKMWFSESDLKTYLNTTSGHDVNGDYPTLLQTQQAHRNDFAHLLVRRMGTWYMDLLDDGWLNSDGIWQNISKLKSIYEGQLGEVSPWNPEVAVIIDERSPYYLACNDNFLDPLYYSLRTRLYRMGLPFNIYLLSDVLDGTVTLPKVNIFIGAIYLTTSERTSLHSALSGKAAIWFHGAGYMNENGAATANIENLTGFEVVQESSLSAQINLVSASPWNDGIAGNSFKPSLYSYGNSSIYETTDQNITYDICWAVGGPPSAVQLGTYGGSGYTGMAVMDYSGFKSFYCGIAGIPSQFLRNVCENMGVHVYIDDDYVMETDGEFFSVVSPKAESQAIVLSNNNYLTCMYLGTMKSSSGGVVNDSFSTVGETRTCWIGTNSVGGFVDNIINKGLWHCDNSYVPGGSWLASDDDNSSGRANVWPLLNYNHLNTHVTAPALIPNSPKGGNCFKFDGVDDSITAVSAWQNESNSVSGNVSVRWRELPSLSDNYAGILLSQPWRLYLQNNGSGHGKLLFRVMNSAGTGYTDLESDVFLSSNTWHDIYFEVNNNSLVLAVNNNLESTPLIGGIQNVGSDVYAGWDATSAHYFKGDLDEIRFGALIPEPFIFINCYLLFIIYYLRKKG